MLHVGPDANPCESYIKLADTFRYPQMDYDWAWVRKFAYDTNSSLVKSRHTFGPTSFIWVFAYVDVCLSSRLCRSVGLGQ